MILCGAPRPADSKQLATPKTQRSTDNSFPIVSLWEGPIQGSRPIEFSSSRENHLHRKIRRFCGSVATKTLSPLAIRLSTHKHSGSVRAGESSACVKTTCHTRPNTTAANFLHISTNICIPRARTRPAINIAKKCQHILTSDDDSAFGHENSHFLHSRKSRVIHGKFTTNLGRILNGKRTWENHIDRVFTVIQNCTENRPRVGRKSKEIRTALNWGLGANSSVRCKADECDESGRARLHGSVAGGRMRC